MITKEQAITEREFHCEVVRKCSKATGPKGGVKLSVVNVRANGQCKTWKRRPLDFVLPIKFGLYEYSCITHDNAESFHLPGDCPINKE